jgi:hypothetical protein
MKKLLSILFFGILAVALHAQTLCNSASINVSGNTLVIQGNYVNGPSAQVVLDGTIKVTGNWTNNNVSNGVITSYDGNGEVQFAGSSAQTLAGSSTQPFDFEQLTINSGSQLVVPYDKAVTAHGATTLNGGDSCFVLRSSGGDYPRSATFIDNGTISGSGKALVECKVTGAGTAGSPSGRYWYLSAPVSGVTNYTFQTWLGSGYDNTFKYWDNNVINWRNKVYNSTYNVESGRGFTLRSYSTRTYNLMGVPLTGSFTKTAVRPSSNASNAYNGFYLIGNPYPSYLDLNLLYSSSTHISSTFYFRTYNPNSQELTYNAATGVGTGSCNSYVAPMQCFWVQVDAVDNTGEFNLSNNERSHNLAGDYMYLKKGKMSSTKSVTSTTNYIRLYLSGSSSQDEALFVLKEGARTTLEKYDSKKLFSESAAVAELYSYSSGNEKLVINSVASDSDEYVFPIGLSIKTSGTYTFSVNLDNFSSYYSVILEDTLTKVFTDLRSSNLTFTSDTVSRSGRFYLHLNLKQSVVEPVIVPETVDSTINKEETGNLQQYQQSPKIYSDGVNIFIENCPVGTNLYICDVLGKTILNRKTNSDTEVIRLKPKCYIVQLRGDGINITRKIAIVHD